MEVKRMPTERHFNDSIFKYTYLDIFVYNNDRDIISSSKAKLFHKPRSYSYSSFLLYLDYSLSIYMKRLWTARA